MATHSIKIRDEGDSVIIITKYGIERGEITLRKITKHNVIQYSVLTASHRNNNIRTQEDVFDDVNELLEHYKRKFNTEQVP